MQQVIWVVQFKDGSLVKEVDDAGNETVFSSELLARKSEFEYIGLLDRVNNLTYSISLFNGELIMSGHPFAPAKEIEGRVFNVSGISEMNYREGVIQYKVSNFIEIGQSAPVTPASFNIGYKAKLPEFFLAHKKNGGLVTYENVQVILSINARTLSPSVAITFTQKTVWPDGKTEMIKI